MVKKEPDVLVTISLEKPDEKFPPIQVRGKLKGFKISKTCDAPDLVNVQFSSNQVQQITNLIRAEEKIVLTLTECEPSLEFPDGEPGENGQQEA